MTLPVRGLINTQILLTHEKKYSPPNEIFHMQEKFPIFDVCVGGCVGVGVCVCVCVGVCVCVCVWV